MTVRTQKTSQGASRRTMLQGALGTGVIAAGGALGGVLTRPAAAASETAIGPATINRQWLMASYAENKLLVANFT